MFNKLSLKTGLLFFIFILIIESLLFFILYATLANDRVDSVMDNLLTRGNSHSAVLEDYYDETTIEHVARMEIASEYSVVITNGNGDIINSSNPVDQEMKDIMENMNDEAVVHKGEIIEGQWKQEKYIASNSPIIINENTAGHVFMFADTNSVKKLVGQLSNQFVFIFMITIVLTLITTFILSRFITLPLIRLKGATEQLSKGKRVELFTERRDELGELAKSIAELSNELEYLKTARNEFLGSISHELRTPLTYMKGYADIINRQDLPSDEIKEYTAIIREETEHLTKLIKNLFELAKMDHNKFSIVRKQIQFRGLIESIAHRINPVFAEKGITFSYQCPDDIFVNIDPDRFEQVLINVLDNALKYSSEGGSVYLDVHKSGKNTEITVSDQGDGIPEKDIPFLFDRLYRVEKSRSRNSGGTGLGLAISKEIVESHGGTIQLSSKPGKGTTVFIKLPLE
ncbi:two-component sensor histidine kinase [Virgibacillus profundi]|uniref:histidine kinase n=1 Tax=Virgibacillus profundi TaxID=2024555 RepID=A0A2A2IHB9_9BACI|nr:HAMP domain-containing sensor histidine kinase [Virgibacillus profundi]PAV30550.1 two-component sensor histidine kinase [Virgibacillus profundi]PXY54722.1 sensor histidine kinase [Virgibacillus profundi]